MLLNIPPALWRDKAKSLDLKLLQLISSLWPKCIEIVSPSTDEDSITREILYLLDTDPACRAVGFYARGQTERYIKNTNKTNIRGRHDIEVFISGLCIVYECKRVKQKRSNRPTKRTLTDKYVLEGVNRFLTGQYSEREPFAGMLAYVIDGNITSVRDNLIDAIQAHALTKCSLIPLPNVSYVYRFATKHNRSAPCCSGILIHHSLLPFTNLN